MVSPFKRRLTKLECTQGFRSLGRVASVDPESHSRVASEYTTEILEPNGSIASTASASRSRLKRHPRLYREDCVRPPIGPAPRMPEKLVRLRNIHAVARSKRSNFWRAFGSR